MTVEPGIYRHFKGNLYLVIGVATSTESGGEYVVYQPLYGDRRLYLRSVPEFTELVSEETYRLF
jgi:hypothetical protein